MNALPRPLSIVVQIVAALVAGVALSVFVGPVLENPSGAVGSGGIEYAIVPGAYAETGLLGSPASGSGGNVGEVPNGQTGTGGSGGVLPGAASESCDSLLCLGGQTGSGGNVGEVPNGQTGTGGSGGVLPGAQPNGSLLGGSASGSGGNTGN